MADADSEIKPVDPINPEVIPGWGCSWRREDGYPD